MTQTIERLIARVAELEEQYQLAADLANTTLARHAELEAEIKRLAKLAYVGEHQFDDCTWKHRHGELREQLAAAQAEIKLLRDAANECRLDLLIQVHELADHIERANYCISDTDMLKQINGQREYAISVASKWNQNGNPFLANQSDTSALDAYVAEKVKESIAVLKAEQRVADWQPIETAPKDTAVLLYCSSHYEIGHFNTSLSEWVCCWDHRKLAQPTHWMPLTKAPANTANS